MAKNQHAHSRVIVAYAQDYATTNLGTTYVEVTSALSAEVTGVMFSSSGGAAGGINVAIGAAGSEVVQFVGGNSATTGGNRVSFPLKIPKGVRVAVSSTNGTNSTGTMCLNLFG